METMVQSFLTSTSLFVIMQNIPSVERLKAISMGDINTAYNSTFSVYTCQQESYIFVSCHYPYDLLRRQQVLGTQFQESLAKLGCPQGQSSTHFQNKWSGPEIEARSIQYYCRLIVGPVMFCNSSKLDCDLYKARELECSISLINA